MQIYIYTLPNEIHGLFHYLQWSCTIHAHEALTATNNTVMINVKKNLPFFYHIGSNENRPTYHKLASAAQLYQHPTTCVHVPMPTHTHTHTHRLVGVVVKVSNSRVADPGSVHVLTMGISPDQVIPVT